MPVPELPIIAILLISEISIYMDPSPSPISIIKMPSGCQRAMTFKPNCGIEIF